MKTFRFTGMALLALLLNFNFTACSDDDDDDGVGTGTPSTGTEETPSTGTEGTSFTGISVINTTDGESLVLTSVTGDRDFSFTYDNQGRCTQTSGWGDYTMTHDPFTITDDLDEDYTYSVSLNNSGYISEIVETYKYSSGNYSEENTGTYKYSYDSSGHLTKISCDETYTERDNEDYYVYTYDGTLTFSWSSGNLMSVEYVDVQTDPDGETSTWTEETTFEYGSTENSYNMYTYGIARWGYFFPATKFAIIGYYGKGTAYLPSAYHNEDSDDYTEDGTMSYTLNDNGTIKTEKYTVDNYTYTDTYTYSTLSESSKAVSDELTSEVSSDEVKSLAKRLSHRRHVRSER